MRIEKLQLKYVGPFEEETFVFKPIPNTDKKAEVHIFTGPNGSGKSTILHALASGFGPIDHNQISKRFHDGYFIKVDIFKDPELAQPYEKEAKCYIITDISNDTSYSEIRRYKSFQRENVRLPNSKINWALFSYSGFRNISFQNIEALKEINQNPLFESLLFTKIIDNTVNQWLANMIAKEAIDRQNDLIQKADGYRLNISKFEKVLSQLMGEKIEFKLITDPTNIIILKNDNHLDFDVIPDGLKSIISWLGNLLMRLDRIPWVDNTPIFKRNIILFLDEIEVHLHPKWQMKVLPIVQELFPNAQIFISTHSPFVVNSVDDAWIYKLKYENGVSTCGEPMPSETGKSYQLVLDEIFDVEETFGLETEEMLKQFYQMRNRVMAGEEIDEKAFRKLLLELKEEGMEVQQIIGFELRQIARITKKEFAL